MTPQDTIDEMLAAMFDTAMGEALPRVSKEDLVPLRVIAVELGKTINDSEQLRLDARIPEELKKLRAKYHLSDSRTSGAGRALAMSVLQMFRMRDALAEFAKPSGEGSTVVEMGFGGSLFGNAERSFRVSKLPKK